MASIDKIVAYFGIGSGSDATRRYVQYVTPQSGWQGFVNNEILPLINLGIHRFLLWMPHGRETTSRKQLMGNSWISTYLRYDAWRLAKKNLAYNWFTTGFAEAFYPLTTNGIEVIAYVGTLHGAPEFDQFPSGQATWEAVKVISPVLDGRCSIAFDSSNRVPSGHYAFNLITLLKFSGYRCYIESTPLANCPHWFSTPCVVSEDQWVNVINPFNWNVLAAPSLLQGEILRGWFGSMPAPYTNIVQWYQWTVPPALAQGYSCCLPLKWYLFFGGSIEDLLV